MSLLSHQSYKIRRMKCWLREPDKYFTCRDTIITDRDTIIEPSRGVKSRGANGDSSIKNKETRSLEKNKMCNTEARTFLWIFFSYENWNRSKEDKLSIFTNAVVVLIRIPQVTGSDNFVFQIWANLLVGAIFMWDSVQVINRNAAFLPHHSNV